MSCPCKLKSPYSTKIDLRLYQTKRIDSSIKHKTITVKIFPYLTYINIKKYNIIIYLYTKQTNTPPTRENRKHIFSFISQFFFLQWPPENSFQAFSSSSLHVDRESPSGFFLLLYSYSFFSSSFLLLQLYRTTYIKSPPKIMMDRCSCI